MGRQSETIDVIMSKYNRLLARYRDLEQQATEKQDKWAELEKEFKINESLTRELCELILAKDPSEMRLGKEYSWSKLKTRDVIQRSKSAFINYNEARTALLRDIQRQSEERRMMIESLKDQTERDASTIEELRSLKRDDADATGERFDKATGEIITEEKAVAPKTMERVAYATQEAAKNGSISIVQYDEEDGLTPASGHGEKPGISDEDIRRGQAATNLKIWDTKRDLSQADIDQQTAMAERAAVIDLKRTGGNVSQSTRKANAAASAKANVERQFVSIDTNEIAQKLSDRHWLVLELIGSTGMCEGAEIVDAAIAALQTANDSEKMTASGFRYILMGLVNFGCLTMEQVAHPTKPRFAVYSLSTVGRTVYATHFGKQPVVSERDILIAEHDNLEHAFGIKMLKSILESNSMYSNVSMSRADNTFKLEDGTSYIPDIVAQGKGRGKSFRVYMEYERGTHHQADFNIKLNKAIKKTRYLDIVCPNNGVAENLKGKVSAWVTSRGGAKSLQKIKIRITTLRRIDGVTNINSDDNWLYVFNLSTSEQPIEHK